MRCDAMCWDAVCRACCGGDIVAKMHKMTVVLCSTGSTQCSGRLTRGVTVQ